MNRSILGRALTVVFAIGALLAMLGYPWPDEPVKAQSTSGTWVCSLDSVANTLTLCILAAPPNTTRYITDITAQSTTSTGGQWTLRTGTGTNCGTGTATLFPAAAGANARWGAPANTVAPTVLPFKTSLRVPEGQDLCVLGVATNTTTIQMTGYVAAR